MRTYEYYCISYIVKKTIKYIYCVDFERFAIVYNLLIHNEVDYLCIKKISMFNYINYIGNIVLYK